VTILGGILMILFGLVLLGLGLWAYFTVLPFFYGILGATIGYWLGMAILNGTPNNPGWLAWVLAFVFLVLFAVLAYFIDPIRRILAGVSAGAALGLAIAYGFDAGNFIRIILAVAGGVVGGLLIAILYLPLIIVGTSFAGAALVMDGVNLILPGLIFFDRTTIETGNIWPWIIWLVIGVVGSAWQFTNIAKWAEAQSGGASETTAA